MAWKRRSHTHRVMAIVASGLLVAAALLPVQASADSQAACGPIISGLWNGVNTALGTNYDCHGNTGDTAHAAREEQNNAANTSYTPYTARVPQTAGEERGNVANTTNVANTNTQPANTQSAQPGTSTAPVPSTSTNTGAYVALGDSVAAGLGLPPASAAINSACGVSDMAYPGVVAASLGMPYRNIACSGATAGDLVTDQNLSGSAGEIAPQLNTAFASGTPSLITITAGANDVYWGAFLRECYVSTCGGSTDQALSSGLRAVFSAKLAYALGSIYSRSGGNPPSVILTGYYQPLSQACAQSVPAFTASEINWINSQTAALNQTIANVTSDYPFARFAPVDFSGHELCTGDSWIQGVSDAAPFHPTARGQQAIAQSVLARTP